jgi:hypothetical protein
LPCLLTLDADYFLHFIGMKRSARSEFNIKNILNYSQVIKGYAEPRRSSLLFIEYTAQSIKTINDLNFIAFPRSSPRGESGAR